MSDMHATHRACTPLTLRRALVLASALGGVGFASPLWAQAVPGTAAPVAAPGAPTSLEEVVVTAQRRSEKLQDVPVAVTALSSRDLARAHIDDASRLANVTPGFTWGQQGSDSFPAIRGARTSLVSAQNDPIIGFYLDGIYQSRTQQQSIPLFDLSRVEVQRGPQGHAVWTEYVWRQYQRGDGAADRCAFRRHQWANTATITRTGSTVTSIFL